ncbi:Diguanylate cyclase [Methylorubrum extorquens]|uniref:Diguanylate cyclase n=1 Tax=Methylorubrum extorquens TaxID=408 RepID=A0A2N9AYL6_METEX|nr:diguanylate cyclase [Methylobacterium sp. Leaf122]KQQ18592.1 diguanylate cyclase [Methylobacterium sp. Leaf122]SOR32411.1 Diguanylate cyclase [Methylorubrum extorquens]
MYPLHPNEVERLQALHDLEVFSSPAEPQYDAICRTAQALFGASIALVSLVGETELRFKGRCGLNVSGTSREVSFCTYTILSDEVLVVEDAPQDERFSANPLVAGEPHIRFYAGAPLVLRAGIHLGSLCLIDRVPRSFSAEQQEQLRDLAQIVVAQLRLSKAERKARESADDYRLLADNSSDLIIRSDLDGTRRYVSPAVSRLLGYEARELLGTHPLASVHPDEASSYAQLLKQLEAGQISEAVTQQRYRRRDSSFVWVEISFSLTREEETGGPNGYVAIIRDISQRKAAESEMARIARHDPLTGLPNRLHFREQLEQEIARTKRTSSTFALLCLDLDRFKLVNDTLGHQAGDRLLKVVAQRIKSVLRTEDTLARLGGDEFVIIQTNCARAEDASRLAERVIAAMLPPVDLGGYPAGVGVSIGIALAPQDSLDHDHLYALADQALYRAKAAGRNTFRLFAEEEVGSSGMSNQGGEWEVGQPLRQITPDPLLVGDLLRDILESSSDCMKLLDQEGDLLFLSAGGLKVMEIDDVGPFLGQSWVELWQGEHQVAAKDAVAQASRGQEARFRGFCHTAKGRPRWWDVALSPVKARSSARGLILAISRDVTVQVELERDLQTTANRYKALIEASATMVWRATPDGSLVESSGWGTYTGQPESAYIGYGWLSTVHPDDRQRVASTWHDIFASQAAGSFEFRALCRDGAYRWTLTRAVPLKDASSQVQEWVGTDSDIHDSKQATEAIRLQEERYRLAILATQDAIWDWDLTSDTTEWSEGAYRLFGYSDAERTDTGAWWKSKIHPDDRERVTTSIKHIIESQEHRWSDEYRFARADGSYAEVTDCGFVIRDAEGEALRMVGAVRDISEQRRANAALRASEERLRLALQAGRMVAWERDLKTGLATRSDNALQLLGIGSGPISLLLDNVHPEDRAHVERFTAYGGALSTVEFRYLHPAGPQIWLTMRAERVEAGRIVGITFDITERKLSEEQAWRAANHDALTGLPNRRLFHQRLEQALAAAERGGTSVTLLLVDLDTLRDVNDIHGHDAGDAVLREVASRLVEGLRASDTVARLGGDEFALLLTEPLRLEHAAKHAEVLLERLRQPLVYRGHRLTCTASIGLAAYPDHHRNPYDLLKDADIALYRAKAQGRNSAVVFAAEMRSQTERRVLIAAEVRTAVAAGQIVPYYQPKICFTTGAIVGFEALARWQHPEKGLLTPGYFGSAFENPELATAIGSSLIRQVAADLGQWCRCGLDPGRVAVNFSSAEFRRPDLAGDILSVLSEHDVPPARFEVEVTETVFLGHGTEVVPATLRRLHDNGILITLDDFGTGFASLTHLKQFPVGHIKVDQSFVRNVVQDQGDAAIITAVIGLGRSLGMQVTAEGVETVVQANRLSAMGCDYAQGYLYGKPMAGSRVPWFLRNWSGEAVESSRVLRLA